MEKSLETKELRLFNLLEVDGVIIKVGKIEEKHITWNLSKNDKLRVWNPFLPINDKRIKPINLTEEWLLKFGFEECPDYYDNGKSMFFYDIDKSLENSEFYIFSNENNEFYLSSMEDEIVISKKLKIKHVHTLQNLYFALSGKELVVSDTVS